VGRKVESFGNPSIQLVTALKNLTSVSHGVLKPRERDLVPNQLTPELQQESSVIGIEFAAKQTKNITHR
jgi:hypothetical protein